MLYENTCSNELLALLRGIQQNNLFKDYLLVGGTSLALQLGHRESVDIDLFTLEEQYNDTIVSYLVNNHNNLEILNNNNNILQVMVDNIKVDFVKAIGKLIEKPVYENGLKLCSIHDIAGMKLNVINSQSGRRKAKDYIDIAFLIKELSLEKMLDIYKWKYDKNDVYNVKLDLMNVDKVNPYTWHEIKMIRKDIYVSDVPGIIKDAVSRHNKSHRLTR